MPSALDRDKVRQHLENFDLRTLFVEELGWDHGGDDLEARISDRTFHLEAIAHKRGMVAYRCVADGTAPDHPTRQKIEKAVAKTVREHLIVYSTDGGAAQYWQWVKREPGTPDRSRLHIYHREQTGEALIQKLEHIVFTLDEEDDLTIVDVSGRVRAAFDVEKVTKRFYERFRKEHDVFLGFIEGIESLADREWYACLMLNRMMFIYFIQKRGFLDGDVDYLRNRLHRMQHEHGKDRFQTFYRLFLLRLFHEGLDQPVVDRAPGLNALLGRVPYLNGGLFEAHDLERRNGAIHIPDAAFQRVFDFFDAYQWHLDDRPLHDDTEINPDVLGYIFEKYINQKQMGAYYTRQNITGYIGRNTLIPLLFNKARKQCPIAFEAGGSVWRLLSDDPDRYFFASSRHGITYDIRAREVLPSTRELPHAIAAGVDDVSRRDNWDVQAPPEYGLPSETWHEHVERRQRYTTIHAKLACGEVASVDDLITYNLDIEKFAQDVIATSEGPELIRAFWKAISEVSVLDPTCGSGAFLFAALNILEPMYFACLDGMRGFLDDLERTERRHRSEAMADFRDVLNRVREHANERYFALKSIVVSNLFGVDIMEEAVEICKLRLFLKLVASLDTYDQIEPLPDIDFNIRAGNALVGFASIDGIKHAARGDMLKERALPDIERRARIADRTFREFLHVQTDHAVAAEVSAAKRNLGDQLGRLREELDGYLAYELGVDTDDADAYAGWRLSHRPFHWFVEFHGTMRNGGFDVIVGNPPYVLYPGKKVPYRLEGMGYRTLSTKNLYALVFERCVSIAASDAPIGLIVQLSSLSSERVSPLQRILLDRGPLHASSFPRRPQSIFDGVEMPVSILISTPATKSRVFTANVRRFYASEKGFFIDSFCYFEHSVVVDGHRVAKFGKEIDAAIFRKLTAQNSNIRSLASDTRKGTLYYQEACRYWAKATNVKPFFRKNGVRSEPSHWRHIAMASEEASAFAACILNSSLFYWYYSAFSDGEHVNDGLVRRFPIPPDWNRRD